MNGRAVLVLGLLGAVGLAVAAGSGPVEARPAGGREPLRPGWKRRVILRVARNEGDFDSINLHDGGGISFGILQWNQRTGDLGDLLAAMQQASPAEFARVFGSSSRELLAVVRGSTVDDRLQPVAGEHLNSGPWPERFRAAGRLQVFQDVQLLVAETGPHFRAALDVADMLRARWEKAIALFFDTAVQQGAGAARTVGRAVANRGLAEEELLGAFAQVSADRARRTARPSGSSGRGLAWREVDGEWHLHAGATDLYLLILRRRLELLS